MQVNHEFSQTVKSDVGTFYELPSARLATSFFSLVRPREIDESCRGQRAIQLVHKQKCDKILSASNANRKTLKSTVVITIHSSGKSQIRLTQRTC